MISFEFSLFPFHFLSSTTTIQSYDTLRTNMPQDSFCSDCNGSGLKDGFICCSYGKESKLREHWCIFPFCIVPIFPGSYKLHTCFWLLFTLPAPSLLSRRCLARFDNHYRPLVSAIICQNGCSEQLDCKHERGKPPVMSLSKVTSLQGRIPFYGFCDILTSQGPHI